jgi:ribosome-associated protein
MDIKKLQNLVVGALEDVKAQDIRVFDTVHLTSLFDRVAIASGTSNRQTKALAASVRDKVKESGGIVLGVEGEGTGEWVLVDLGDIIVHIMQPAIRAYYRLEEIWGEKEVKFGAAKRTPKSAATDGADSAVTPKKAAGRHLTVSQSAAIEGAPKKTAARKTSTRTAVTKTAKSKPAAKKTPVAKNPTGKPVKAAAAKKAPVAAAKKAPAKRAPARTKAAQ